MSTSRGIALGLVECRIGNFLRLQIGFEFRFVALQTDHEPRAARIRGPPHHIDQVLGGIGNDDLGMANLHVGNDRKSGEQ